MAGKSLQEILTSLDVDASISTKTRERFSNVDDAKTNFKKWKSLNLPSDAAPPYQTVRHYTNFSWRAQHLAERLLFQDDEPRMDEISSLFAEATHYGLLGNPKEFTEFIYQWSPELFLPGVIGAGVAEADKLIERHQELDHDVSGMVKARADLKAYLEMGRGNYASAVLAYLEADSFIDAQMHVMADGLRKGLQPEVKEAVNESMTRWRQRIDSSTDMTDKERERATMWVDMFGEIHTKPYQEVAAAVAREVLQQFDRSDIRLGLKVVEWAAGYAPKEASQVGEDLFGLKYESGRKTDSGFYFDNPSVLTFSSERVQKTYSILSGILDSNPHTVGLISKKLFTQTSIAELGHLSAEGYLRSGWIYTAIEAARDSGHPKLESFEALTEFFEPIRPIGKD